MKKEYESPCVEYVAFQVNETIADYNDNEQGAASKLPWEP